MLCILYANCDLLKLNCMTVGSTASRQKASVLVMNCISVLLSADCREISKSLEKGNVLGRPAEE